MFGWGLREKYTPSDKLLQVDVPIMDTTQCKKLYTDLEDQEHEVNVESNICAGESGKDSCSVCEKVHNDKSRDFIHLVNLG